VSRIVVESHKGRRILGQLGPGEDLLGGLLGICRKHRVRAGSLRVTGVLQDLALANYDGAGKGMTVPRTFRGAVTLVSGEGIVAEHRGKNDVALRVVISRQRDNGVEVLGGQCTGARVVSCEFIIDAFEDVILRRDTDRGAGMPIITEAISAADIAEVQEEAQPSGDELLATAKTLKILDRPAGTQRGMEALPQAEPQPVSEAEPVETGLLPDEPEEEIAPERMVKPGDILEHQQFGRCEVEKCSSDEDFVTVRLRNNRLVRLSTEVLDLRYDGDEGGGRQLFTAVPAPR
jgi:predicted DNA-binding protein with PD1-like motif